MTGAVDVDMAAQQFPNLPRTNSFIASVFLCAYNYTLIYVIPYNGAYGTQLHEYTMHIVYLHLKQFSWIVCKFLNY
jgi:hypothetical protein